MGENEYIHCYNALYCILKRVMRVKETMSQDFLPRFFMILFTCTKILCGVNDTAESDSVMIISQTSSVGDAIQSKMLLKLSKVFKNLI